MTFSSLYEMFNPLTEVRKQHFWDWFSGDALNSRWTFTDINPTGSGAMEDAVDGGYKLSAGASNSDQSMISFNDKRQYAHDASTIIWVWKTFETTNLDNGCGFYGGIGDFHINSAEIGCDSSANFDLSTRDNSTGTNTTGSVVKDTSYHTVKIVCDTADIELIIDGLTDVTKTTNRPTLKMQAGMRAKTTSGAVTHSVGATYVEAYNT
jgi:hypothetical protein